MSTVGEVGRSYESMCACASEEGYTARRDTTTPETKANLSTEQGDTLLGVTVCFCNCSYGSFTDAYCL